MCAVRIKSMARRSDRPALALVDLPADQAQRSTYRERVGGLLVSGCAAMAEHLERVCTRLRDDTACGSRELEDWFKALRLLEQTGTSFFGAVAGSGTDAAEGDFGLSDAQINDIEQRLQPVFAAVAEELAGN
jgi:hypothetical protein